MDERSVPDYSGCAHHHIDSWTAKQLSRESYFRSENVFAKKNVTREIIYSHVGDLTCVCSQYERGRLYA